VTSGRIAGGTWKVKLKNDFIDDSMVGEGGAPAAPAPAWAASRGTGMLFAQMRRRRKTVRTKYRRIAERTTPTIENRGGRFPAGASSATRT
jgi:hypothetical protein